MGVQVSVVQCGVDFMNRVGSWLLDKNGLATLGFLFGLWSYWRENRRKALARFNDLKPHFEIRGPRREGAEWIVPLVNHGGLVVFVGGVEAQPILDKHNVRPMRDASTTRESASSPTRLNVPPDVVRASDRMTRSPAEFTVLPKQFGATFRFTVPPAESAYSLLLVWRDADSNAFLHRLFVSCDRVTGNAPEFKKHLNGVIYRAMIHLGWRNGWPLRRDCFVAPTSDEIFAWTPRLSSQQCEKMPSNEQRETATSA